MKPHGIERICRKTPENPGDPMHELILRRFFEGALSADELVLDLRGSIVPDNEYTYIRDHYPPEEAERMIKDLESSEFGGHLHPIVDMPGEFEVLPEHLVKLCDAVLTGKIDPKYLHPIGFCLMASDAFHWDGDDPKGELVGDLAWEWSGPEVNYPLTLANVAEWRHKLLGEAHKMIHWTRES